MDVSADLTGILTSFAGTVEAWTVPFTYLFAATLVGIVLSRLLGITGGGEEED